MAEDTKWLAALVQREEPRMIDDFFAEMRFTSAENYQDLNGEILRLRCERLIKTARRALDETPLLFVSYARELASTRGRAGYGLGELQLALSLFEGMCWKLCIENIKERDALVRALTVFSGMIGEAKDKMALVYLSDVESDVARAARSAPDAP